MLIHISLITIIPYNSDIHPEEKKNLLNKISDNLLSFRNTTNVSSIKFLIYFIIREEMFRCLV